MASLDVFNTNAFETTTLTAAVNLRDSLPSRIRDWGLFRERPVSTKTVYV